MESQTKVNEMPIPKLYSLVYVVCVVSVETYLNVSVYGRSTLESEPLHRFRMMKYY